MKQICKECGKCCNPLVINIDLDMVNEYVKVKYKNVIVTLDDIVNDDLLFVYMCLTEISSEKAFNLVPKLKIWKKHENTHYFECMFLNKDKKCLIHNKLRPESMCGGYPFYGEDEVFDNRYHKGCGYRSV